MFVKNSKVKYIRKENYNNLKEVCEDCKNVYIGRRGIIILDGKRYPENSSIFCNPFKVDKDGNLEEVLNKYENIVKKINDENLWCELDKIKDKNLYCWCIENHNGTNEYYEDNKYNICHGQILLKIIGKMENNIV